MDRFEASAEIGTKLMIDEKSNGKYIGELLEVITIPKKPWRGRIKIIAVLEFPEQNWQASSLENLRTPLYTKDEIIEITGSKIKHLLTKDLPNSYEKSIMTSLKLLIRSNDSIFKNNDKAFLELEKLFQLHFPTIKKDLAAKANADQLNAIKDKNEEYIEYSVKSVNGSPILFSKKESHLPLHDCPFELELLLGNTWIIGHYTDNWNFHDRNGRNHILQENQTIRLAKRFLEPYQLLLNELEKPALQSLEKSLKQFKLTHKDLISCHNYLLSQLLTSKNNRKFKGVNFMVYQTKQINVVVQHHYEREIHEEGVDHVYDRFEYTSNTGKRVIVTYTNEYTRDFKDK
jgi:hypothetical protein